MWFYFTFGGQNSVSNVSNTDQSSVLLNVQMASCYCSRKRTVLETLLCSSWGENWMLKSVNILYRSFKPQLSGHARCNHVIIQQASNIDNTMVSDSLLCDLVPRSTLWLLRKVNLISIGVGINDYTELSCSIVNDPSVCTTSMIWKILQSLSFCKYFINLIKLPQIVL